MHDVLVIGGGPAGSTAANLLAREGLDVVLLEREHFPRFQIGESLLPYNNDVFRRLGIVEELNAGPFVPKYGGTFVTADGASSTIFRFDRALGDGYKQAYQVRRADFDLLLLNKAREAGAKVREGVAVSGVDLSDPRKVQVVTAAGEKIEARFAVDCSGHGSVIGQRVAERHPVKSLRKVAFFAHYRGVPRDEGRNGGNTVIVILGDAWFWLIPVTDEITSVGLVVDRDILASGRIEPEVLLDRTIAASSYMRERMQDAERITPIQARRDFSFRMSRLVGPNFTLAGDAAGFLDPIFSTGVLLAMTSAMIVADAVVAKLRFGKEAPLRRYERRMQKAIDRYFGFIEGFYRPEFLEVFFHPQPKFGIFEAIVGLLGGNAFAAKKRGWALVIFFGLVRLQKWRRVVAPTIDWDKLPRAAACATDPSTV